MTTITTPKQLADKLQVDQKLIRRHLRSLFGTHYKRWELTPEQVKAVEERVNNRKANSKPNNKPASK